jgi:hypothetical protein
MKTSSTARWDGNLGIELYHRSQPEHLGISQGFAGTVPQGIGRAPAGMHDVLEIRLKRLAGADLIPVDCGEQPFETPDRPTRPGQVSKVHIKRARPRRKTYA